ncbi:unnamed protein product [Didymodactylos carnosus]|uniref:Transcription factor BYE1 n=1 Tax=Didymodactylos carnosus TaxID=1234261 RepID=A0A813ST76_9BILA|nr:unnamed protein product [Didymodactylos carnosus]CAF3586528.1 unnamed protein product [Didymodactylos carnosus]
MPSSDHTGAPGTDCLSVPYDNFSHGSQVSDDGSNNSHEDEQGSIFKSRKSYPTRTSRPKINYRDIERGMYGDIRNSLWNGPLERVTSSSSELVRQKPFHQHRALNGSDNSMDIDNLINERHEQELESKNNNSDEDLPLRQLRKRTYNSSPSGRQNSEQDDEEEEQFQEQQEDDTNMNRRLWCICKQAWDVNRFMIRCDNCSDWFHGDCVGITKNQARELDMNDDQFICPICKDQQRAHVKKMAEESNMNAMKRKRIEAQAALRTEERKRVGPILSSSDITARAEQIKRQKTIVKRDSSTFDDTNDKKIHCILHGCDNWSKLGWVYCSTQCIRKHINDTLRAIQIAKGSDKLTRDDIMLYEQKSDTILNSSAVPAPVDICDWITRHPSFQVMRPELKKATYIHNKLGTPKIHPAALAKPSTSTSVNNIKSNETISKKPHLLVDKQDYIKKVQPLAPKLVTTTSISTKPLLQKPHQQQRQDSKDKSTIKKPVSKESQSATNNNQMDPATIRTKVRNSLNEFLLQRSQKVNLTQYTPDDIKNVCVQIEEEMYRIFGNTGDKYKQKFRTILFNIKDKNNDIFRKIVSKELNAKQLVQMNADDMARDDVKEQRRLEILKEAEAIKKYNAEAAIELAKRSKIKVTRQGLVELETADHSQKDNQQLPSGDSEILEKISPKPPTITPSPLSNTKVLPIIKKPNILTAVSKKSTNNEKSSTQKPVSKIKSVPSKRPLVETTSSTTLPQQTSSATGSHSEADILARHRSHVFDKNCQICNTNMTVDKHLIRQAKLDPTPYSTTPPVEPQTIHEQIDITIPMQVDPNISNETVFNKNKEQQETATTTTATPISGDEVERDGGFYPSTIDGDNDYIEPESPTGDDAKLYDDDDWSDITQQQQQQQQRPAYVPSTTISRTTVKVEESFDDLSYQSHQPILDDYKPTSSENIRQPDTSETPIYFPTPITRGDNIRWRGSICPDSQKIYCQSSRLYGEADYLCTDIPDKITICGRLRPDDLYSYIEQSLPVRDVLIMNLVSSNDSTKQLFDKYVDLLRLSNRAAVATKSMQKSIKDIYVIPVNDLNVFPTVIRSIIINSSNNGAQLPFSTGPDGCYLFMIVVASGKRTSTIAANDSVKKTVKNVSQQVDPQQRTTATTATTGIKTLTYKPVMLHDEKTTTARDPRLRNKDPRLPDETTQQKNDTPVNASNSTTKVSFSQPQTIPDMNIVKNEPTVVEEQQQNSPPVLKTEPVQPSSNDDIVLQQIISESLNRVRQALTLEDQTAIIVETVERLKPTPFYCNKYLDELKNALTDLQKTRAELASTTKLETNDKLASVLPGDNHRTEDMDVEDDIEDKSSSAMEYNDVDYRFLTSAQSRDETPSPRITEPKKIITIPEIDQDHRRQLPTTDSDQRKNIVEEKITDEKTKDRDHRRRRSRFSAVNITTNDPTLQITRRDSDDRQPLSTKKHNSKLPVSVNDVFPDIDEDDETNNSIEEKSQLLLDDEHTTTKITNLDEPSSAESTASTFSNKFRPVVEADQNVTDTNTLDIDESSPTSDSYKPIRFSISKTPTRQRNSSISQQPQSSSPPLNTDKKTAETDATSNLTNTTSTEDPYETAPQYIEDLIQQIQQYGFEGLSLQNLNWTKNLSSSSIRTSYYLNYLSQNYHDQSSHSLTDQSSHIFSSSNSTNNSTTKYFPRPQQNHSRNTMPRYRDFDRPEASD